LVAGGSPSGLSLLESSALRLCSRVFNSAIVLGLLTILTNGETSFHEIERRVHRRHIRRPGAIVCMAWAYPGH